MTKKTNSAFADAYLRFLHLTRALQQLPGLKALDANELELLQVLGVEWRAGHPLTVRQTMDLNTLGSPATMHRRLKKLIDNGLIAATKDAARLRVKILVPTPVTLKYFERLGASIVEVGGGKLRA